MDRTQLESIFDQQAPHYDQQWVKLAAFNNSLHLLLGALFSELPQQARMLCVGAGTGAEIHHLATRFPGWTFTAVEPSAGMVVAGRRRAEEHGYADRCRFHHGYLDSLPGGEGFDCASSLLVSQFILDPGERSGYFRAIAARLKPGGLLACSDLASDLGTDAGQSLLAVWLRTMATADVTPEGLQRMREAYARDVAILPPQRVAAIIMAGGFEPPVPFFQAGMIHGWYSRRAGAGGGA